MTIQNAFISINPKNITRLERFIRSQRTANSTMVLSVMALSAMMFVNVLERNKMEKRIRELEARITLIEMTMDHS